MYAERRLWTDRNAADWALNPALPCSRRLPLQHAAHDGAASTTPDGDVGSSEQA